MATRSQHRASFFVVTKRRRDADSPFGRRRVGLRELFARGRSLFRLPGPKRELPHPEDQAPCATRKLKAEAWSLRLKLEPYESDLKRSERAKHGRGAIRKLPRAKRHAYAHSTNAHEQIRELRGLARRLNGASRHVGDEQSRT